MMSRGTDPVKLKAWTERLARFETSNHTVVEFCVEEQVSEGAFYHWKRRLSNGGQTTRPKRGQRTIAQKLASEPSGFQSVVVTPPEHAANVRITLPDGAVIELGHDLPTSENVLHQLFEHQACSEVHGCWT